MKSESREPENKGLEDSVKTRVCREFSWQQTLRLEKHLGKTLLGLSLLVTGRDSGLWIELGLKKNSYNSLISLCKVTHHYSGTENCFLPQTRSVLDRTG